MHFDIKPMDYKGSVAPSGFAVVVDHITISVRSSSVIE